MSNNISRSQAGGVAHSLVDGGVRSGSPRAVRAAMRMWASLWPSLLCAAGGGGQNVTTYGARISIPAWNVLHVEQVIYSTKFR